MTMETAVAVLNGLLFLAAATIVTKIVIQLWRGK